MGTNPRYIGNDTERNAQKVDRISGRVGYKVASITFDKQEHFRLQPPHFTDVTFELSDEARCEKGRSHVDLVHCSCGFYAYNTLEATINHWTTECLRGANEIILEVALSGEVVVAERGYRATHQRVTRMFLPHCFKCAARGEVFAFHEKGFLVPACRACVGTKGKTIEFKDFIAQNSPTGFRPMEIVPSVHFTNEIMLFKSDAALFGDIQIVLDRLAAAGKFATLEQVMSYAAGQLDSMLELGTTDGDQ